MKRFHKLTLELEKTIQYEQSHRKSFFQNDFVNMCWNRQKLSKYIVDFDIIQIVVMENKNQVKKPYTIMVKDNIIARTKKDGNIIWIDYENSIIEPISDPIHGRGVKFIKCFDQIVIYGDLEKMLPIFKRFTIQLDFAQHYQLVKRINNVEKYEVYRIRSKLDRNDYQCRIYDKKLFNATSEKQLEKEMYILRRMNEECIQKYYETFENQDQIIVIQELVIGGNLEQYLQKWSLLSEDKSSKLFFRLFKTLAYLHSKGIMHRDLKPENIGLRLNGNLENPCIISFSLADVVCIDDDDSVEDEGNPKHLFQRCGTPGFVAPEILQNQKYDCKVDVYSMGIMIYYALTGKRPFDSDNYKELIEKNEEGDVDISSLKLSKEGMQFMSDILEPDPYQRITSQNALNHIWFRSEKLNRLIEFKTNKRFSKNKFKSPYQRLSVQNSPNLLPQILVNQRLEQNQISPVLLRFGQTVRNSINSSIFRMTNLNGSFSPKQIQFNQTNYIGNFGNGKFVEQTPSPIFEQRTSQSKSSLKSIYVKQLKTVENK